MEACCVCVLPKNRNTKRTTIVATISADGTTFIPFVIISRVTIEREICLYNYIHRENIFFAYQPNSFMTTHLFNMWANEIFFPEAERRRIKYQCEGPALLHTHSRASMPCGISAWYKKKYLFEELLCHKDWFYSKKLTV